uniref:Scavenger receptor class B member 1 n=1 Tax=Antheraea pernyi TaxID=7119 RepID=A0A890CBE2_ANTPE|nr:scavenger receptor class B member 1 [Antheraea pernyi]
MKDFVQILNRVSSRRCSNTTTNERELRDLTNNRFKYPEIDKDRLDPNIAECEGLNGKFEDIDFNGRRAAIINRLFEKRRKGELGRQPKCLFILLMLGFFSLGGGFFILFLHPYDFLFKLKIVFQDGGEIFEMWRKPEAQVNLKVYLFNITNAEEYLSGQDEKLKLEEVGPYAYREGLEHKILGFNDNGTLNAVPLHPLTWLEDMSEGNKEDDILYLPHIALLSIAHVVSKQSFVTRFALNNLITLTNSQPLVRMTAREFMMGYKSQLMTLGNTFMPGWISFDSLGLIDRMYDFTEDYETIFTGETDVGLSGLVDTYRGSTDLPHWQGKHCSNVQNASDGTKFQGGVGRNDTILFYRKSLCRSATLRPVEEGVKSGMSAYRYTFSEHMLDNGKYLEENKCFCREGVCLPDGLIDVTDCYYGFPIALSYPHFYQGEDILFGKVEGLAPKKEDHETSFWVQTESGLPLAVSTKIQINMALGDLSAITNVGRFTNMYLPLLWFEIGMYQLPPSLENRFKMYLNVLPVVEQVAMYALFVVGALLVTFTIYIVTFKVMFKFDKNMHKGIWLNKCGSKIYSQCEIPMTDADDKCTKLNNKLNERISLNDRNSIKGGKSSSYEAVDQSDSESEFDLEVIDDECQFDGSNVTGNVDDLKLQISH